MGHLYRFIEPVLLLMLKERGKTHGYDLSMGLEKYSFTDAEIERAALYRTLNVLEKNGYVTSEWNVDGGGPARKMYTLTKDGEEHLREWAVVLRNVSRSMSQFVRKVDAMPRSHRGR
jgi:DNA-binding PadR family transcriptional regulator